MESGRQDRLFGTLASEPFNSSVPLRCSVEKMQIADVRYERQVLPGM